MKKFMAILFVLFALFELTLGSACAEEERGTYTDGDYEYALLADGTAEIVEYNGSTKSFTMPDTLGGYRVTAIGDEAFSFCDSLMSITIPDSITDIGSNPFEYCLELTDIRVSPDHPTLETIDGVLFAKTEKRLITYPCAFEASSYTIPDGIRLIGDSAFYSCGSLTSITIPNSLTDIGDNPFQSCEELTTIQVSPNHPTLETINGVLFEKTEKRLVTYPRALEASSYTIPNGIRSIGDCAFFGCDSLKKITIPNSVTAIGGAFSGCSSLTSITISDSVTAIDDFTFLFCTSLTSITIPDSVTAIGDLAFTYCPSLISITIPDSVTTIGIGAFAGCTSLMSITIPDSVTTIGDDAFSGCGSLTLTVGRDSYAKTYADENNIPYRLNS